MRIQSLILLVLFGLTMSVLHAQKQVNIPGFGTLPVTKNGDNYQVTLDNYGTFDFKGTLNPFDLETAVKVEQLKEFPGYEVMSNLGLKDIKLKVSSAGLFIGAKADTEKNLKVLFDFLNIEAPYVTINTKISKSSFALESILNFAREPVIAKVIPPAGTELHVEKLSMLAGAGTGGANISVITEVRMKPTKWDPALKTKFELAYNLRNQEITGSGSMMDTWADPFGLDKHLKKNSISFTNTAVSFGWVIGAPSPTTLGLAVENATFFDLEFGAKMSISPANGQIALEANRNKMTMNDFSSILREGFGLSVPDVFPNNVYVKDVKILYSPNGGEIGEVEIEQGFAMKGRANLLGAVEAEIDYFANWEDGFYLDYRFDANLKDALMKEIKKTNLPQAATEKVLGTFQLRKVHTHLEAGMDLKMSGETHVEFEVFEKTHKFDIQASLDPETIVDAIIDKIIEQNEMMKIAGEVAGTVGNATKKAYGIASDAWNNASKFIGSASRHITHSKSDCDNNCVPDLAEDMYTPLLKGSNDAVLAFYKEVYPQLIRIVGNNTAETVKLRNDLVWNEWVKVAGKIDRDWHKIIYDDTYISFYIKPSSASNGGKIYRRLVREQRDKHIKFRTFLYRKLMKDLASPSPILFYEKSAGLGEVYDMNSNGSVGAKVASTTNWKTTWSEVEYYRAGGKDMVLFYQQADGGFAEMYRVKSDGTLSGRVASTKNWKATWSDIEYYQAGGKDMMLFYEHKGGGSAAMYEIKANGTLGKKIATTKNWKATWTDIEYYRAGSKDMLLFYEQSGGGAAAMYEVKPDGTLGAKIATTNNWRSSWSDIEYISAEGRDMMMFYEKSSGTAEVYEIGASGGLGSRIKHIEDMKKTWGDIEAVKSQSIESQIEYLRNNWESLSAGTIHSSLLFYEDQSGSGEFYEINSKGGAGSRVASTDRWRSTWSDVEYYRAGGKDMLLFYQQSDGGYAAMYTVEVYGTLGRRVASTKSWRSTWSDIEYYRADGKDMLLFYQRKGGGSAEMYEIKGNGTLGSRVATTDRWKSTWTDIEYYRAGGKDMMLFYEQANGGRAEMYRINDDGTLGNKVTSTNSWRSTWTDIEYYSANGKDFMLFYEKSTGTGAIYEVAPSGGLGSRVVNISGWRKTWSDIEAR